MERRRFARVQLQSSAVVRNRFVEIEAEVEDLSINGVRLKANQKFDLHKEVQIRIFFKSDSSELWIETSGFVIRHEANGMVIQFTNMSIDSYVHLQNIITYLLNDTNKVFDELFFYMTKGSVKGPYADFEFQKSVNLKVDQRIGPE